MLVHPDIILQCYEAWHTPASLFSYPSPLPASLLRQTTLRRSWTPHKPPSQTRRDQSGGRCPLYRRHSQEYRLLHPVGLRSYSLLPRQTLYPGRLEGMKRLTGRVDFGMLGGGLFVGRIASIRHIFEQQILAVRSNPVTSQRLL